MLPISRCHGASLRQASQDKDCWNLRAVRSCVKGPGFDIQNLGGFLGLGYSVYLAACFLIWLQLSDVGNMSVFLQICDSAREAAAARTEGFWVWNRRDLQNHNAAGEELVRLCRLSAACHSQQTVGLPPFALFL